MTNANQNSVLTGLGWLLPIFVLREADLQEAVELLSDLSSLTMIEQNLCGAEDSLVLSDFASAEAIAKKALKHLEVSKERQLQERACTICLQALFEQGRYALQS